MRRLVFLAQAKSDLVQIQRDLTRLIGQLSVARNVADGLRAHCRRLAGFSATIGRPRPDLGEGLRSQPQDSYIIFFRYADDRLEVVTILHGARDIDALFGKN